MKKNRQQPGSHHQNGTRQGTGQEIKIHPFGCYRGLKPNWPETYAKDQEYLTALETDEL